ncbi:hypothetical protein [Catenulispora subtropica]|uniref:Integral membrane protein n=1 Tax=Catenulispora subtropica TaxID=450798 RepID=A0ABP5C5P8_9ACTN
MATAQTITAVVDSRPEARHPGYVPGTPRWARIAAHAVPLAVLPSSIWRILMTAGLAGVGHTSTGNAEAHAGDWIYVVFLSTISEGFALLTLGLVKPWGEVVPRRLPLLGGRRIPVKAAVIPACVGAGVLALVAVYFFVNMTVLHWHFSPAVGDKGTPQSHLEVSGWSRVLFTACYLPAIAWPVLVVACTVAYYRRRTRHQ